ncbi:flagellar hook-length control protein FliK [Marivita sp.]|uniref:flagellar hook-length control protein FliK n=1 Tax=Marivita sp. TaxID=2003365 RepID=UPI0025B8FA6F|nr:flagellar hook-length control protein FliK [Marivita sp.]
MEVLLLSGSSHQTTHENPSLPFLRSTINVPLEHDSFKPELQDFAWSNTEPGASHAESINIESIFVVMDHQPNAEFMISENGTTFVSVNVEYLNNKDINLEATDREEGTYLPPDNNDYAITSNNDFASMAPNIFKKAPDVLRGVDFASQSENCNNKKLYVSSSQNFLLKALIKEEVKPKEQRRNQLLYGGEVTRIFKSRELMTQNDFKNTGDWLLYPMPRKEESPQNFLPALGQPITNSRRANALETGIWQKLQISPGYNESRGEAYEIPAGRFAFFEEESFENLMNFSRKEHNQLSPLQASNANYYLGKGYAGLTSSEVRDEPEIRSAVTLSSSDTGIEVKFMSPDPEVIELMVRNQMELRSVFRQLGVENSDFTFLSGESDQGHTYVAANADLDNSSTLHIEDVRPNEFLPTSSLDMRI